jgi:hypothetical protein
MKLTLADWRQRAHNCLVAANAASNPEAQLQWLVLFNSWRKFADLRERGQSIFIEKPDPGSVTVTAGRTDGTAVEGGNRLRGRLMLDTDNDESQ